MDIPAWAKYLATNPDGTVYAFSGEPEIHLIPDGVEDKSVEVWDPISEDDYCQLIEDGYPDMFWQESLIKVGE